MVKIKKINFKDIERLLKKSKTIKFIEKEPLSKCDPYYTEPVEPYELGEEFSQEAYDRWNAEYEDEIKQDSLRYPLILEMLEKKKELAENPIIFDKEEEYYEQDPHKLVNFDEYFTPFFEQEANEAFFRNIKDPLRIKWEEIPEEDRRIKIVPIEETIRKIKYDEVQKYLDEHIICKDIVVLFVKHIPEIWPIRRFYDSIEKYVNGKTNSEIYEFLIEKVLLLSSSYVIPEELKVDKDESSATSFLDVANTVKKRLFKDLIDCLREKNEDQEDLLSEFINKYDLFHHPFSPKVTEFYKFRELAKIVVLLNLSFFNIFPIIDNDAFEKLRRVNKPLFLTFLWYLKDLYWGDYGSILKLKDNLKNFFNDELEYDRLIALIDLYPLRVVQAKEYFYTHHDIILREEVERKLSIYDQEQERKRKEDYRYNADFYVLNKELQGYEKQKEKIYAKFRKEEKSQTEIDAAIENAYKGHLKRQAHLGKILFKRRSDRNSKPKEIQFRDKIEFYVDEKCIQIQSKSYVQLINETLKLFKHTLNNVNKDLYQEYCNTYKDNEPMQYSELNIYKKIFEDNLIESNVWNKFRDYCFIALDRYPERIKHASDLFMYQQEFVIEFMRDIIYVWGESKYLPKNRVLYKPTKRRRARLK